MGGAFHEKLCSENIGRMRLRRAVSGRPGGVRHGRQSAGHRGDHIPAAGRAGAVRDSGGAHTGYFR